MWVLVIAGNEPENDVAALTRGASFTADVERMMAVTNANVVRELKAYPEKIGILSTVLDARVLHLPILTALAVARDFGGVGNGILHEKMKDAGMKVAADGSSQEKLRKSDLVASLSEGGVGPRQVGGKPGSDSIRAFEKLALIASANDEICNHAIGLALQAQGFLSDFETEVDLGTGLVRRTDILMQPKEGSLPIRLEIMWSKKSGRANIANYALKKLFNYGRALGVLDS